MDSLEVHAYQPPGITIAYARSFCDLQLVSFGCGEETYVIMQKEFLSVGATCWAKAIEQTTQDLHRLFFFAFALDNDNGPDNQGSTSRIKRAVQDHDRIMFVVTWCVFHQYHLIIKSLLAILDKFVWSPPSSKFPTSYFSGVSAISNSWRAAGGASQDLLRWCRGLW